MLYGDNDTYLNKDEDIIIIIDSVKQGWIWKWK